MSKFKVGDKVRILDAMQIEDAIGLGFKTGEIYEVVKIDGCERLFISNGKIGIQIFEEELQYIEKACEQTKNQRITALEKEVAELKAIVHELCKPSMVEENKSKLKGITIELEKTPNQQRKEIIEKAKEFVDENGGDDYHFEIDEKEGQILAWKVVKRGVKTGLSTCHHNEVFNEDIGRAIAFGRAENLDVSEFEQAVQPTEVVVGQVVKNRYEGVHKVFAVRPTHRTYGEGKGGMFCDSRNEGYTYIDEYDIECWSRLPLIERILNDTNAIY